MSDVLTQLKEKEKTIQNLRNKKSRLEGQKEQILNTLKTNFGIDTLEEAEKLQDKKQKELEVKKDEVDTLMSEIDNAIEGAQ